MLMFASFEWKRYADASNEDTCFNHAFISTVIPAETAGPGWNAWESQSRITNEHLPQMVGLYM